jgi:condensin complex subunit 2
VLTRCLQVRYDRKLKHVDILTLKKSIWDELKGHVTPGKGACKRGSNVLQDGTDLMDKENDVGTLGGTGSTVDFQSVLKGLQDGDGAPLHDLSVHLCFICLLHLANEHELDLKGVPEMDRIIIGR